MPPAALQKLFGAGSSMFSSAAPSALGPSLDEDEEDEEDDEDSEDGKGFPSTGAMPPGGLPLPKKKKKHKREESVLLS